jgi:4-alpha-glucanotransferase
VSDRKRLGLATEAESESDLVARRRAVERLTAYFVRQGTIHDASSLDELVDALHQWLARSPAELISLTLEDLWLEESPQNMPGTGDEELNWRHKHHWSLEAIAARDDLREKLERIDHLRT